MDYKIQLLSFLFSFLFGILFSFLSRYHYDLVYKLKSIWQYVLSFVFILDISFFYILALYFINNGVIHLYFVLLTFLGYAVEKKLYLVVKSRVKAIHLFAKTSQKWYNPYNNKGWLNEKESFKKSQKTAFVLVMLFGVNNIFFRRFHF